MRWLCWFSQCRWWHIGNVLPPTPAEGDGYGLYQCHRCKTLSIGSQR